MDQCVPTMLSAMEIPCAGTMNAWTNAFLIPNVRVDWSVKTECVYRSARGMRIVLPGIHVSISSALNHVTLIAIAPFPIYVWAMNPCALSAFHPTSVSLRVRSVMLVIVAPSTVRMTQVAWMKMFAL